MDKKIIAIALLMLCWQVSFADTCPSVKDIKNNALKGWKIYDSEEGTPLSPKRESQFKKEVDGFILAEWMQEEKIGMIHCYYRNKDGSDMEAFLAKPNFKPDNSKKIWYEVSGAMQCAAGPGKCIFKDDTMDHQFAKRD